MTQGITRGDTCAGCKHFPLKDTMQTDGWAWCPYAECATVWDRNGCPLHTAAKDRAARVPLVRQLMEREAAKDSAS